MGRTPCCDKTKVKKGPWSLEEDQVLKNFVAIYGNGGNWVSLPKRIGLNRCGKSCRLRWLNYLRPNIKHGDFTEEEDQIIHTLYNIVGSRWSIIASKLQGRTDNDVKNYWNTKLKKKISASKFTKSIPIKNEITNSHFSIQAYINTNYNSQNIDMFSKLDHQSHLKFHQESDEKYSESNINVISRSSSMTQVEVSSQYSSSSTNDNMSNVQENEEFWMDLFSESFDDVVVGSQLVDDKINEIASLLNVFVD